VEDADRARCRATASTIRTATTAATARAPIHPKDPCVALIGDRRRGGFAGADGDGEARLASGGAVAGEGGVDGATDPGAPAEADPTVPARDSLPPDELDEPVLAPPTKDPLPREPEPLLVPAPDAVAVLDPVLVPDPEPDPEPEPEADPDPPPVTGGGVPPPLGGFDGADGDLVGRGFGELGGEAVGELVGDAVGDGDPVGELVGLGEPLGLAELVGRGEPLGLGEAEAVAARAGASDPPTRAGVTAARLIPIPTARTAPVVGFAAGRGRADRSKRERIPMSIPT
jgi:hypothetical protein